MQPPAPGELGSGYSKPGALPEAQHLCCASLINRCPQEGGRWAWVPPGGEGEGSSAAALLWGSPPWTAEPQRGGSASARAGGKSPTPPRAPLAVSQRPQHPERGLLSEAGQGDGCTWGGRVSLCCRGRGPVALVHRLGAHSGVCREHKFGPEPPRPLLSQNLPIRCPGLGPPSGLRSPCSPSDKGLPAYLLMASCYTLPTLSTLPPPDNTFLGCFSPNACVPRNGEALQGRLGTSGTPNILQMAFAYRLRWGATLTTKCEIKRPKAPPLELLGEGYRCSLEFAGHVDSASWGPTCGL